MLVKKLHNTDTSGGKCPQWFDSLLQKTRIKRSFIYHRTFEHTHPFQDGNGRTGRMILIWMLARDGYGTILIQKKNQKRYWSALKKADQGKSKKWHRFAYDTYKKTINEVMKSSSPSSRPPLSGSNRQKQVTKRLFF